MHDFSGGGSTLFARQKINDIRRGYPLGVGYFANYQAFQWVR